MFSVYFLSSLFIFFSFFILVSSDKFLFLPSLFPHGLPCCLPACSSASCGCPVVHLSEAVTPSLFSGSLPSITFFTSEVGSASLPPLMFLPFHHIKILKEREMPWLCFSQPDWMQFHCLRKELDKLLRVSLYWHVLLTVGYLVWL